jgi:UDP-glucose 4-epimerase
MPANSGHRWVRLHRNPPGRGARREAENQVHVVDNLSTSPIELDSYLDSVGRPANLSWDICSVERYHDTLAKKGGSERIDQIYHLASAAASGHPHARGQARPADHQRHDPHHPLALEHWRQVVDMSTSEIYGGGRDGYCSENDFKIVPPQVTVASEYAVGKLAAEISLVNTHQSDAAARDDRPAVQRRGTRQSGKGGFVLPRFISQALANQPLTVYGDGSMIRAFTHVQEHRARHDVVMEKGRNGEGLQLGNPANKTSILDLAERVVRVTNSSSKISFVNPKELFGPLFEEANDKYPDADRAINELDWHPQHGLDETIRPPPSTPLESAGFDRPLRGVVVAAREPADRRRAGGATPAARQHRDADVPARRGDPDTIRSPARTRTFADFELLVRRRTTARTGPKPSSARSEMRGSATTAIRSACGCRASQLRDPRHGGRVRALCHDHDLYAPTLVARMVEVLDAHPSALFVHCGAVGIDDSGRTVENWVPGAARAHRRRALGAPHAREFLQPGDGQFDGAPQRTRAIRALRYRTTASYADVGCGCASRGMATSPTSQSRCCGCGSRIRSRVHRRELAADRSASAHTSAATPRGLPRLVRSVAARAPVGAHWKRCCCAAISGASSAASTRRGPRGRRCLRASGTVFARLAAWGRSRR